MSERRACFDFEVAFSNGGGLRGHDFRLDIEGEDIDDEALARHIIEDMRLLMVGEVKILNKRVIEERHKRAQGLAHEGTTSAQHAVVDLSHTIEDGMITYRGLPAPVIGEYLTREQSRAHYAEGTEFHFGKVDMSVNTGTYLDVPFHRFEHGHDLSALPLHRVAGLPGVVVRATGAQERGIDWHHFVPYAIRGHAVLVQTSWDRHWGTSQYFDGHPFLTEKAARYLADEGAALVGIDSLNIDDTSGGTRPAHSILLGAEIPIVEHLTHLDALPERGFTFSAVPPKFKGLGTFPVRAHALVPQRTAD